MKFLKTNLFLIFKILSLIGIILALFLLWEQLFQPEFKPCSINQTINCDAIISGQLAKILNIPTPLYGLAGYLIIFIVAWLKNSRLILATAIFGVCFCLGLAYIELFQLQVICPVCILCQLDMITVLGLSVWLSYKPDSLGTS